MFNESFPCAGHCIKLFTSISLVKLHLYTIKVGTILPILLVKKLAPREVELLISVTQPVTGKIKLLNQPVHALNHFALLTQLLVKWQQNTRR